MRRTKVVAKFLAAALAFGVCGIADGKAGSSTKSAGVHGVITNVQSNQSQITVRVGNPKKGNVQTVQITIGNGVTIQGKNKTSGSFATLHAGDRVIIEPDTANPTTIIDMGSAGKRTHGANAAIVAHPARGAHRAHAARTRPAQ